MPTAQPAPSNVVVDHGYTLHVVPTVERARASVSRKVRSYRGTGNLAYRGGPVEAHPKIYVVYWGWTSDPNGEAPYLNAFLNGIGGSSWLNIVTQYSSSSQGFITNPAAQLAGTWNDPSAPPAGRLQTSDIAAEALRAVAHFGYAADANYVVATPTGHSTADFAANGGQACAWHTWTSSSSGAVAFTNLPYMSDAGGSCGQNSVNAGAAGTLDGVSIVAGHEVAEAQTDPEPNSAWLDSSDQEIGDKCSWIALGNTNLSTGRFAVQPLFSDAISDCPTIPGTPPAGFVQTSGLGTDIGVGPTAHAWTLGAQFADGLGNSHRPARTPPTSPYRLREPCGTSWPTAPSSCIPDMRHVR